MDNNKVIIIEKGGNCIFEIDKASLEIKRKIIGNNWFSPTNGKDVLILEMCLLFAKN